MTIYGNIKRIRSVNSALQAVRKEADKPISIALIAKPQVEEELRAILLVDADEGHIFGVSGLRQEGDLEARLRAADLAVAVVDTAEDRNELLSAARRAYLAKSRLIVVTAGGGDEAFTGELKDAFKTTGDDIIFVPAIDEHTVETVLLPAIARKFEKKELALAAKLPVMRDAVVEGIIADTAKQNALIGVAVFIPGADMPLLTLNQIRMVLRMAAAYNEELSVKRLNEVLAVVGSGLAFRAVARQLLGFIPAAGWAVKGGIAYGGTYAIGEAAKKYFESKTASGHAAPAKHAG